MYLKPASDCNCDTCAGSSKPPKGSHEPGFCGGWGCQCECHRTPLTDAKLRELDMQDLELGHKYRELKDFCKFLEKEMNVFHKMADKGIKLATEAIDKLCKNEN